MTQPASSVPGPLAIFKPTVDLSDYRFEFLAENRSKSDGLGLFAPRIFEQLLRHGSLWW